MGQPCYDYNNDNDYIDYPVRIDDQTGYNLPIYAGESDTGINHSARGAANILCQELAGVQPYQDWSYSNFSEELSIAVLIADIQDDEGWPENINFESMHYWNGQDWADCCEFIYWEEPQYWWDVNEYGNNYYYPVLPKFNKFNKFDESLGLQQTYKDGEPNIPFGSDREWDEDDIESYVTNSDIEDDRLTLDLDLSEVEDNSISDKSEQNNVGILVRDYGIKYEDKEISANKALVSPQKIGMNKKNTAY
jgi:hypothetical protein